ncbi:dihydroxyacetone kinase subunit DhaL [Clostridium sp.]|uniref:dihydroxyacetone kinase subunit DhaL n=1 Tax=Clostridium sp. TaxID=1506 RepID=UPI002910F773|nr:dihydroxyacetone kinase subunit DhaL [Clostridium sp.]MDU5106487.1 dihydroxyacetone kinase subunit DhaL [Clostridium sp.]
MGLTLKEILYIFDKIENKISLNKQFLTDLDAAIGDGDHGINLSKGFRVAKEKIQNVDFKDWGEILKTVGMAIVSNVGGASGPLYGTAFMKASMLGKGKIEITIIDYRDILQASIEGVKMRGKAEEGDKTMLDALIPAYNEVCQGIDNNLPILEILKNSVIAAEKGMEYTKLIAARKGRASYLGDRSIGHEDPGATSSFMILEVIFNTVKELRE